MVMAARQYVADEFTVRGYTVKIIPDEDAESPREWDNAGTMVCWHSRYNLGDEQRKDDPEEWLLELASRYREGLERWLENGLWRRIVKADTTTHEGREQFKRESLVYSQKRRETIARIIDAHYIMLPLGLYDHSGISMYVGSGPHRFDSGGWDSGQVGWIYCTREKAVEEFGKKRFTKRVAERAEKSLRAEVEVYDQFLRGDVYGYTIEKPNGEEVGSCWGFFGVKECANEAQAAVPDEPCPKGGDEEDEAHEDSLT